ncbi:MAG: metalloregulator ArsR/SmtB family transcription factor [Planctomycetaceae bacterium]|nr:metalloregulator ArsR/SmtB family transcription factor [Planctomycetaceae bacterium]
MRQFMTVAKALADDNRVRVLMFLRRGEMCLCQIIEMLHLAPSTVSKHMSVLSAAALVEARKEGRWMYYRRSADATPPIREALAWLDASLNQDPAVRQDAKDLKLVRKRPLQELCCHYKNTA